MVRRRDPVLDAMSYYYGWRAVLMVLVMWLRRRLTCPHPATSARRGEEASNEA